MPVAAIIVLVAAVIAQGAQSGQADHASPQVSRSARYDVVITGGRVVDGTGRPATRADVGILDGRIAAVGVLPRAQAARVIDARGLIVAPGFVDVHTHADDLASHPAAENFIRMGVTTVVAGNCGSSALDVADALGKIRDADPA